jgi:hypothetical protein
MWSIGRSMCLATSPCSVVLLSWHEEYYQVGNEWLKDEFFIDISACFITLVHNVERVFEADKLAKDFFEVLARVKRALANRHMD